MRSTRLALAIGTGSASLGMGLLVPILPAYAASLGASATLIGLLLTSFGLTRLVVGLPSAWLAQRIGHRRLLVGSPALIAPVAAGCAVVGGFWPLAAFCLVEGGAAAAYATAGAAAAVAEPAPQERGMTLALYQAAGLLGAALGPAIGGIVGQQFGLRAPFVVYALLSAAVAWWLGRALGPDAFLPPLDQAGQLAHDRRSGRWWLASRDLLPLWLFAFILAAARTGTQLVAAPLLGAGRLGLSPRDIGLSLSTGGFAAVAVLYPAGWLAGRYGRKPVSAAGGLLMAGALVIFAASSSTASYVLAALMLGVAGGATGLAPVAYLADRVSDANRTLAVGTYRTLGDAGAAAAPLLLGWLIEQGSVRLSFLVTAAALLAGSALFAWLSPAGIAATARVTASSRETADA